MGKLQFGKAIAVSTLFALGACQQPSLYSWGAYDSKLLAYYQDVSHLDAFEAELFSLIEQSGQSEKRLPPGIYAEYGYLQLQKGDSQTAIKFFKMEKESWPESKVLMDTMIKAAGGIVSENETDQLEAQQKG